ncbi:MAG TPA: hypothetical protein VEB61_06525 [Candidatus Binatia bacterium]|nr:hypothetical protein [Candidatus Binatia bacterium]
MTSAKRQVREDRHDDKREAHVYAGFKRLVDCRAAQRALNDTAHMI